MEKHSRTSTSTGTSASTMSGTRFAVGVGGVLCVALAACSAPPRKDHAPVPTLAAPSVRAATPFAGTPSVGVLIGADGDHFCTASVVASPKGNVIATAAHCLQDAGGEPDHRPGELEFAPGFSEKGRGKGQGSSPYGRWKVSSVHLDDRWTDNADDADVADYAFLTLAPDARGRQAQQVVGAVTPDWSSGSERRVTVVGYPNPDDHPSNRPIACTTDARPDPELPQTLLIECAGFWDGTSGGPWLADYRDAGDQGRLIGVLSGGDTDRESTAALFDGRARSLYERAAAD
ncbi:trypsin-like serine peptidase [Streptomyces sp. NPDC052236]|uniref:trypsin-like serine peptidase n=1 Tax=Streptomyces sp. NPDC052236 TaxID=3365686 RepID=UPI0037CCC80C